MSTRAHPGRRDRRRSTPASDPAASAWVSANAGSGKTHVLAQRVIRLLLDGIDPGENPLPHLHQGGRRQHGEPRVRDARANGPRSTTTQLDEAIARRPARKPIDARRRARARRLFARALETPGGLKVQTIHAFCTRLLQQFPFEANVAARFRGARRDRSRRRCWSDIRAGGAARGRRASRTAPLGRALADVDPAAADMTFQRHGARGDPRARRASTRLARRTPAASMRRWRSCRRRSASSRTTPSSRSKRRSSTARICRRCGMGRRQRRSAAEARSNDQEQCAALAEAVASRAAPTQIDDLSRRFSAPTKHEPRTNDRHQAASRSNIPSCASVSIRNRSASARCVAAQRAVAARDRTVALLTIADEVIDALSRREGPPRPARLRRPDRQDAATCSTSVRAAWVHYKLDLGIDHVLIDEAQDTSPEQWDIIKPLVGEFSAGAGARGTSSARSSRSATTSSRSSRSRARRRTQFDEMRAAFRAALTSARSCEFAPSEFKHSFRSAPSVLDAVDTVFAQPQAHRRADRRSRCRPSHEAVRDARARPGRALAADRARREARDRSAGMRRSTRPSETSPRVKLARQIAAAVRPGSSAAIASATATSGMPCGRATS